MRGNTGSKVIVVGAGPAGLVAALTLKHRDIPFELIERGDRAGTHSYALALHPWTIKKLKHWGLDGRLPQDAIAIKKLVFCDEQEPRFTLDLRQVSGQEEGLLVVGQDHLENALIEPLEAASVPIKWSHRLASLRQNADGVELELERLVEGMSGYAMARLEWQVDREMTSTAQYVIGTDGHFSMVRRKLGIEFPSVARTQSFAVFEFKSNYQHNNEARIVFGEAGVSVLWPLPGGYCRWGFEIPEAEAEQFSRDKDRLFMQVGAHGYQALESGMLHEMIRARAPWFDGSIQQFRWRMIVRFEKRLADKFGDQRAWLAGDAGHLTGPIGMQSMNVGMHESETLADLMADVIEGKADPSVFKKYDTDREREWRALIGLTSHFTGRPGTDPFILEHKDRILACIPASLESIPQFAEALGLAVE